MALSSSPARPPIIPLFSLLFLLFLFRISSVFAGDVSLDDDSAPKSGNCNNPFDLVLFPFCYLIFHLSRSNFGVVDHVLRLAHDF